MPATFTALIDTDNTSSLFSPLSRIEIQNYIIEKISHKAYNYPHLFVFNWATEAEFIKFEKSIKGEIYRLLLTIFRNLNAFKASPNLKSARESLSRQEVSIDATLPSTPPTDGGKTYHDIVGDGLGDPLSILLAAEAAATEEAAINALSAAEKAKLIQNYDEKNKAKRGVLFADIDDEPAPKPVDLDKYRRRPKPTGQTSQLDLFFGGAR